MRTATPPPDVTQLHVWWREISPMIWRRLLVRSESSIANLQYILQMAMGWEGYHLHHVIIRGKRYGIPQPGGWGFRMTRLRSGSPTCAADSASDPHSTGFSGSVCHRVSKATRGEDLDGKKPVSGW
jgi:Plasmid pRiA4b ORF-3-like protein